MNMDESTIQMHVMAFVELPLHISGFQMLNYNCFLVNCVWVEMCGKNSLYSLVKTASTLTFSLNGCVKSVSQIKNMLNGLTNRNKQRILWHKGLIIVPRPYNLWLAFIVIKKIYTPDFDQLANGELVESCDIAYGFCTAGHGKLINWKTVSNMQQYCTAKFWHGYV